MFNILQRFENWGKAVKVLFALGLKDNDNREAGVINGNLNDLSISELERAGREASARAFDAQAILAARLAKKAINASKRGKKRA